MNQKISIITVCLNNIEGLKKTIPSVLNQTYKNIEYIIIDGKSNDGSIEFIKSYGSMIDCFISEKDYGIYDAMNKGIEKATGDYLLFLNSGDWLYKNDVIWEMFIDERKEDVIYGNLLKISKKDSNEIWIPLDKLGFFSFMKCPIPHPTAFVRKEIFKKFGKFDVNFKIASDYELWFRFIYKNGVKYKHLNIIVSVFVDYGGMSSSLSNYKKILQENKNVRKKYYPFLLSMISNILNNIEFYLKRCPLIFNIIRKVFKRNR